jgi:hypothetical protein
MVVYNWGNFISGVPAIFYGLYQLWIAYKTHKKYVSSKNWPVTLGEVTETNIYLTGGKGGTRYQPEISYQCSVLGHEHTGKFRLGRESSNEEAEEVLTIFPVGADVKVTYNPENPEDWISEFDEEEVPWVGFGAIVFGVVVICLAFVPWGCLGRGCQ